MSISEDEDNSSDQEDCASDVSKDFEVDAILDRKISPENGEILYRIRWIGFGAADDTWEPKENLLNCQEMVDEFEIQREEEKQKRREKRKKRKLASNDSDSDSDWSRDGTDSEKEESDEEEEEASSSDSDSETSHAEQEKSEEDGQGALLEEMKQDHILGSRNLDEKVKRKEKFKRYREKRIEKKNHVRNNFAVKRVMTLEEKQRLQKPKPTTETRKEDAKKKHRTNNQSGSVQPKKKRKRSSPEQPLRSGLVQRNGIIDSDSDHEPRKKTAHSPITAPSAGSSRSYSPGVSPERDSRSRSRSPEIGISPLVHILCRAPNRECSVDGDPVSPPRSGSPEIPPNRPAWQQQQQPSASGSGNRRRDSDPSQPTSTTNKEQVVKRRITFAMDQVADEPPAPQKAPNANRPATSAGIRPSTSQSTRPIPSINTVPLKSALKKPTSRPTTSTGVRDLDMNQKASTRVELSTKENSTNVRAAATPPQAVPKRRPTTMNDSREALLAKLKETVLHRKKNVTATSATLTATSSRSNLPRRKPSERVAVNPQEPSGSRVSPEDDRDAASPHPPGSSTASTNWVKAINAVYHPPKNAAKSGSFRDILLAKGMKGLQKHRTNTANGVRPIMKPVAKVVNRDSGKSAAGKEARESNSALRNGANTAPSTSTAGNAADLNGTASGRKQKASRDATSEPAIIVDAPVISNYYWDRQREVVGRPAEKELEDFGNFPAFNLDLDFFPKKADPKPTEPLSSAMDPGMTPLPLTDNGEPEEPTSDQLAPLEPFYVPPESPTKMSDEERLMDPDGGPVMESDVDSPKFGIMSPNGTTITRYFSTGFEQSKLRASGTEKGLTKNSAETFIGSRCETSASAPSNTDSGVVDMDIDSESSRSVSPQPNGHLHAEIRTEVSFAGQSSIKLEEQKPSAPAWTPLPLRLKSRPKIFGDSQLATMEITSSPPIDPSTGKVLQFASIVQKVKRNEQIYFAVSFKKSGKVLLMDQKTLSKHYPAEICAWFEENIVEWPKSFRILGGMKPPLC